MDHVSIASTTAPAAGAPADGIDRAIADCLLALLQARAPSASVCPSEVARRLAATPEQAWRALLPQVRAVAVALAMQQILQFSQRGRMLDPQQLPSGPLRIRRGPGFPSS